ncbi:MAG: hypothetical protein IT233_11130 [Bacteroidia bacterium]|nr:hypothetical protein [Bacteroidia bacterium]
MKKILLVAVIMGLSAGMGAQSFKSFSHDSTKFLGELAEFFDLANKKEGREFVEGQFLNYWINDKFSKRYQFNNDMREFVYRTCDGLLKKQFRPYPEFHNFIKTFMHYFDNKVPEKNYIAFRDAVDKVMNEKNKKNITIILATFEGLFRGNVLYSSNAIEWVANNANYTVSSDTAIKISWTQLDLIGVVKNDSLVILNTSGTYFPTANKWVGKMGKVNWTRTGLDENLVYAELRKYDIKLREPTYDADSVTFYHKQYFTKPLIGRLVDKAVVDAKPENASFPKFNSYTKRFKMSGVAGPNVDFDGGFSMNGNRFIGAGNKEEDALLIFKRNGKPFLIAASKSFIFKEKSIISPSAQIVMVLDTDSVYHPGVQLLLQTDKRKLTLLRTSEGIQKSPYYNDYHRVEMHVEELVWMVDSAKIDMKTITGSTQGDADFESVNYYRQERFDALMGMDQLNPLTIIKDFSVKNGGAREFSGKSLASYMTYDLYQIQPLLVRLATDGYISYDIEDDEVIVHEKLFNYIWARAKKKDYDVLSIHSGVKGGTTNAVLSLLSYDLKIYGVQSIALSDSQNVRIYPSKGEVILKKNRGINFAGYVKAGLFDFFGKDFSFEYDRFKINLNNIDSLKMSVLEKVGDNVQVVKVKTVIEDITGDLLIDDMGNKSGLKSQKYPGYPVFNSKKNSFVYYDRRSIHKGVYNRDKFYFKLDPFSIDSLDNFKKEFLALDGDFVSAGIFPQMRETLKVQPDYSLGFVKQTPTDGFALYGNKGTFNTTLKLSHKGLQGAGDIKFLTSQTYSSDILFFPDSTNANANSFTLGQVPKGGKVEFPNVFADTAYIHFEPKRELMQIYKVDKPLVMMDSMVKFHGRLDLQKTGLTGKGRADFAKSELTANKVNFKNKKFQSDTADFRLKSMNESVSAFSTLNVNALVDLEKREGDFKSNGKGSVVRFDVNKYICFMDRFKWFMDKDEIELSSTDTKNPPQNSGTSEITFEGPEFISVHPKQDSLRFYAPRARFDLKNFIISAKEVKYINVADARIYPDSGNVTILKDAEMKTLSNAKIIANSVTKYHTLYEVNANIFARKSYSASGKYDYVDENKKKQTIFFSSITVDTTFQTFADAEIKDTSKFMLSPNFGYKGKVKLRATNQFLLFDGYCSIAHGCKSIPNSAFKFTSQINPEKILIPVASDVRDPEDRQLGSGIMSTVDSNAIYTAFLSKRYAKNDVEVLASEGFLFFDKVTREYRIASKEKLTERNLAGQFISLDANSCMVYGEGKINLGSDLGQVKLTAVGTANHNLQNDSAYFDLMILMDFFFDAGALEKMAEGLNGCVGVTPVNFNRSVYEKGLREMLGKDQADKLISEVNLYGKFKKFPDELEKGIFFTDLKMRWNPRTKSYISSGKIGVGNILKYQVNKQYYGYIELKRKRSGDELTIYIECDAGTWYYFNYTNGLMQSISGKDDFNTIIKELKPDKRQKEVEKGQKSYQFSLSTKTKRDLFLKKMKQNDNSGDD